MTRMAGDQSGGGGNHERAMIRVGKSTRNVRMLMRFSYFFPLALLIACGREAPPPPPPSLPSQARPELPRAGGPTLPFVDEAAQDGALVAYREELLVAVRRRDADALVRLVDPNIRTSFGGGGGEQDLRRMLEDPKRWADLEQLLTLGGTFLDAGEERTFWAPYVYSAWPDAHDAFTFSAVIAEEAPLLDAPNGKPVATLSRNIVERVEEPRAVAAEWMRVKTLDGRTGFVATKLLRSPVGYRAGFRRDGGRWRMNALVAGD